MDGKRLTRQLRQLLNEESGSNYLDSFTTYDLLNQAAQKLNDKVRHIKAIQELTTIADQASYTLRPDYIKFTRESHLGRPIVRFDDGTTFHYLPLKDDDVRFRNKTYTTTSVDVPESFSIEYDESEDSQVTGTETTGGSLAAGKSTLTDSAANFNDVNPGDTIHNTTDGAMGVVLSKTSSTVLVTALFDGTNNFWTSADAYVIQPQAKYKITLTPPPSNASNTVTVEYLKRPKPVYSDYDVFMFPLQYMDAILFYSVGFYKYRNQMQDEGNTWFAHADAIVKKYGETHNKGMGNRRAIVNFKKRQRNY